MTEFAAALNKQNQAEMEALSGTNEALLRTVATLRDEMDALKARVAALEGAKPEGEPTPPPADKTHQQGF